jgi:hypothetical protein
MKRRIFNGLGSIERPVALMLAFLPIGSLAVAYFLVRWTGFMATHGAMGDPIISDILRGFGALFREYAIPVLILTVALALLNLLSAFAAHSHRAGKRESGANT